MKRILFSLVLAFANLTLAAPVKVGPCQFRDYQKIKLALDKYEVRSGAYLINRLDQILAQERGPRCTVFATVEGNPISGQAYAYEINYVGREVYDVKIIEGSIVEADSISIAQVR